MTSQLSRERIEQYLQSAEGQKISSFDSGKLIAVEPDCVIALCRMALAGMDSEPVAKVDNIGVCWYADDGVSRKPAVGEKLYAAPPAPVAVPDDSAVELLATDLMKRIDKITGERHSVATLSSLRVSIVEACRAAMLKAVPVTTATVPDGWKLVPVDPTEEMLKAAHPYMASSPVYKAMVAAAPAATEQEV